MLTINVTLNKEDYGLLGSSDYWKNMSMATVGLPEKFGAARHTIFLVEKKETNPRVHMYKR